MNAYLTVDLIKNASILDISGTGDDTRLRRVLENVSRKVDDYCNRHFFTLSQTKKFDGDGGILLLIPDLISIDASGLKTDDNKDRTFETTWATTDYLLLPSNADPTGGNGQSRPYTEIEVDLDAGTEDVWTDGRQTVEIAAQWGFNRKYLRATETVNEELDATETGVDITTRTDIEAGHTILVDSEQMYVLSYSSNTLTVLRGVNGTTGATHSSGAVIDIFEYPGPVIEATLALAAKWWKRKDSGFASSVGFPDGSFQTFKGMDPDVKGLLDPLQKFAVGI